METQNEERTLNDSTAVKCSLLNNSLKYGLIAGVAMVLLSLLLYVMDVTMTGWVQYASLVILLAGIVLGNLAFRDKCSGGFLSYGRSLGSGVLISVFAGLLMAIYSYLFFSFFDPGELVKLTQIAEDKMFEQGLSDEQVDDAMSMTKMFMTPVFISISSLFSMALWGTVFSLLVSIFIKKNDNSFDSAFPQS
ncbi:MAG: hypothetical protein FD170_1035 [Bacteroidetes bacterium]|nr:MAG: hypothetical protein FD170_1035 [Bacteroidota bacterium]